MTATPMPYQKWNAKGATMTIIEHRVMEIICHYLPEIAKQLKRIADALEQKKDTGNERD